MALVFHPGWWRRGLVVLLSLGGSTLLALALKPMLHDEAQLLPFTVAVMLSSALGGLFAGLAATALSFLVADFFFIEPVYEVLSTADDYAMLFIFLLFGVSLSFLNNALSKANDRLLQQSRQLTRSNEELQRFAYSVSHDLQEPLRSVRMFTDLFLERNGRNLEPESARCLDFVRNGAERMKGLIEAILEFSLAGSEAELVEINAGKVVSSALQDLDTAIGNSRAEVRVKPLPVVRANEKQLGRVFLNLVGNAIKYHGGGRPILIEISAEKRPEQWIFSVKDNGSGIAAGDRERIFETFQRVKRGPGGYGLGLATCKRIIEQHGGRIWVESAVGESSDFRFTLPRRTS